MKYLILALGLTGCTYNVDYVKSKAPEFFERSGYEIVAYEGYQGLFSYCGGDVWYLVKRADSPVVYHGYLCKWGKEIHLYNFTAINAIAPAK